MSESAAWTHDSFAACAGDFGPLSARSLGRFAEDLDVLCWISNPECTRLEYINPACERILGQPRAVMYRDPRAVLASVHPDDVAALCSHVGTRDPARPTQLSFRTAPHLGSKRINVYVVPVKDAAGRVHSRFGVASVADDLQQAWAIGRANPESPARPEPPAPELQRLANAVLLTAQAAHEIANPIAGIASTLELIARAVPSDHPYARYVDLARSELRRLSSIVRVLHGLYEPPVAARPVDVCSVIADVVELLRTTAALRGVSFSLPECQFPSRVLFPEASLRQVLFNIFQNAVDASPAGSIIHVTAAAHGTAVIIETADSGPGIPPGLRSRIFEPGFTTKASGRGLGLAVVSSLAEANGAVFELLDRSGGGALARLTIPQSPPPDLEAGL